VIRELLGREGEGHVQRYVIVVEHDLSVLDYLSDFICCLYGKPGAYGVVTLPFSVREGINIFLAGVWSSYGSEGSWVQLGRGVLFIAVVNQFLAAAPLCCRAACGGFGIDATMVKVHHRGTIAWGLHGALRH
jgi:hypothetical protein